LKVFDAEGGEADENEREYDGEERVVRVELAGVKEHVLEFWK
jgi:hypothetical protein